MSRTIVIGDIHGCHEEFAEILEKTKVTAKDQVICVGDLINKGPSSIKTLEIAMNTENMKCLVGNHEHAMLYHWRKGTLAALKKDYQQRTVAEFGGKMDRYMHFIETWPYYLDFPEFSVVHAGIRPNVPLERQSEEDLVYLRTLENDRPWYESYEGSKLIVHGHWARQGLTILKNVIGLDSGCVYGKELSALVLPSREIVSVRAKKAYCPLG